MSQVPSFSTTVEQLQRMVGACTQLKAGRPELSPRQRWEIATTAIIDSFNEEGGRLDPIGAALIAAAVTRLVDGEPPF